jgi:hypothetical protein
VSLAKAHLGTPIFIRPRNAFEVLGVCPDCSKPGKAAAEPRKRSDEHDRAVRRAQLPPQA